jgi:undecaprenyl-diphosphatase
MIEKFEHWDQALTLGINQLNAPFLDQIMWWSCSSELFYLLILVATFYIMRKEGLPGMWIFFLPLMLVFALTDLTSVHGFKNVFERYRPSHQAELGPLLHLHQFEDGSYYQGGLFGFVSSHSANFAGMVTFVILALKPRRVFLFSLILVHLLIIYSRVYLGVHYVGDVVAGSLVGIAISGMFFLILNQFQFFKTRYGY